MSYSPYNTAGSLVHYDPYQTSNTTTTGYHVPTYNANNTNG